MAPYVGGGILLLLIVFAVYVRSIPPRSAVIPPSSQSFNPTMTTTTTTTSMNSESDGSSTTSGSSSSAAIDMETMEKDILQNIQIMMEDKIVKAVDIDGNEAAESEASNIRVQVVSDDSASDQQPVEEQVSTEPDRVSEEL